MKINGIKFEKMDDGKFYGYDKMTDFSLCVEKVRGKWAVLRESRESHDVWTDYYKVIDLSADVCFPCKDKQEAFAKFADFVKNGAPYERRAQGGATIGELIAARRC